MKALVLRALYRGPYRRCCEWHSPAQVESGDEAPCLCNVLGGN